MKPPGLSRVINFRNARPRSVGGTCIQTALSRMKSKHTPRRKVWSRPGSRSGIQRMRGSGWRLPPSARMAAEGSTATTSWPCAASQAASRPVPAPTSRMTPGRSGSMLISQSWIWSKVTLSYWLATVEALCSYQIIDVGSDNLFNSPVQLAYGLAVHPSAEFKSANIMPLLRQRCSGREDQRCFSRGATKTASETVNLAAAGASREFGSLRYLPWGERRQGAPSRGRLTATGAS